MKRFAEAYASVRQRLDKRLRDIVGMNVMQRLHSQVWQRHQFAACELRIDVGVEIAGGIDWKPAGSTDMTGLQNRRGKIVTPGLVQQIILNRRFLNTVLAEWMTGCLFGRRHLDAVPHDPNRAAV